MDGKEAAEDDDVNRLQDFLYRRDGNYRHPFFIVARHLCRVEMVVKNLRPRNECRATSSSEVNLHGKEGRHVAAIIDRRGAYLHSRM